MLKKYLNKSYIIGMSMLKSNKEIFDEALKSFKSRYKAGTNFNKKLAAEYQEELKGEVEKHFNSAVDGLRVLEDNKEEDMYEKRKFLDSKKPRPGVGAANDFKVQGEHESGISKFENYIEQVNTSAILGLFPKDEKEYNKMKEDFGRAAFTDSLNVPRDSNIMDWKNIDVYQNNIGTVKSLVEFFFNMMMVYNNSVITKDTGIAKGNPGDWYVPLPDEWTKPDGILASIMNTTAGTPYAELKNYGIPLRDFGNIKMVNDDTGAVESRGRTGFSYNNGLRFMSYFYTNAAPPARIDRTIEAMKYNGAFITPFITTKSDKPILNVCPIYYNYNNNFLEYSKGQNDKTYGGINKILGFGGEYAIKEGGRDPDFTGKNNICSYYVGYQSRFLYDIIYSNGVGTKYPVSIGTIPDLAKSNVTGNDYGVAINDLGGIVGINGEIPALNRDKAEYRFEMFYDSKDRAVAYTNSYTLGLPVDNEGRQCWANNARQAYNANFLGKVRYIGGGGNVEDVDVTVDMKIYNVKLWAAGGETANNVTELYDAPNIGNSLTTEMRNVISFANYGGYLTNILNPATFGSPILLDPIGFIRARKINKVNGGDVSDIRDNIKINNDTIVSEEFIREVVRILSKLIFDNLQTNNIYYSGISAAERDNLREQFQYRLERAIIMVRKAIFEAPIPHYYNNSLTEFELEKKRDPGTSFGDINLGDHTAGTSTQLWNTRGRNAATYVALEQVETGAGQRYGSDRFTYNKGQPLTVAFTKEFREAFKTMMNKAILARERGEKDSSKMADFGDVTKVLNAGGNGNLLVKLDVMSILEMRIYDRGGKEIFHMYKYLRDMLDSKLNIVQMNLSEDLLNPIQRRCTGGLWQAAGETRFYTKLAYNDLIVYMNKLVASKNLLLEKIEKLDELTVEEIRADRAKYRKKIYERVDRIFNPLGGTKIVDDIAMNRKDKVEQKLKVLETLFAGIINELAAKTKEFEDRYKRYRSVLNSLKASLEKRANVKANVLIKAGEDESRRISLYESQFEEEYIRLRTEIIVILTELTNLLNRINALTMPANRQTKYKDMVETAINRMVQYGSERITNFKKQLKRATEDIADIIKLDPFVKEIQKDDRVNKDKPFGNGRLEERNIGIWVVYKDKVGLIDTYNLFNILNGSRIERIDRIMLPNRTRKDILKKGQFRGLIIIRPGTGITGYYLAKTPPKNTNPKTKDGKLNLREYREELFKSYPYYGKKSAEYAEMKEAIRKIVYAYANYLDDEKAADLDIGVVNRCGTGALTDDCKRLISLEEAKRILRNIIKQYSDKNNAENAFRILVSSIKAENKKGGKVNRRVKIKYI